MLFYVFLIFGIIFSLVFLICLIEFIKDKDFEILPCVFVSLLLAIILIGGSVPFTEKVGIVCSVEKVPTSYMETIRDGKIERVPTYSYLILFQTEDGEYRTFTTTNVNFGILKEGDSITYTIDTTEKIKEE